MMEISYYRDLGHNYLVIEIEEPDRDNYQFRMIEQNTLKRLLPCSIHNLNGGAYLYYETDSRVSLISMAEKGGLRLDDIRMLLSDLKEAGDEAREYLLDPTGLLLSPEFIYKDAGSGRFSFLFCPVSDGHYGFDGLCQELTQLVDPADIRAANLVFSLCEASMSGSILPADALSDLERAMTQEPVMTEPDIKSYDIPAAGEVQDQEVWHSMQIRPAEDGWYGADEEDEEEEEPGIGRLLISVLFLAVTGALLSLRMFYNLTRMENTLDIAGAFICALLGVYGIAGFFMHKRSTGETEALPEPAVAGGSVAGACPVQTAGYREGDDPCNSEVRVRFDRGRVVNIAYN